MDEIAQLRERLFLDPGDTGTMVTLADLLEQAGDYAQAIDFCQRALRCEPYRADVAVRLGRLWGEMADPARARGWFERALSIDPGCGEAALGLAGVEAGAHLSDAYIRTLFDQYAGHFDEDLVGRLGYRAPEALVDLLRGLRVSGARTLDLGCGTGLSGRALAGLSATIDGIDLSPGMVAKADAAGVYRRLEVAEACAYLGRSREDWDLIAAVDMLNYVGDLGPILTLAAARLAPGGRIAGTIELGEDVALTDRRRFTHSPEHLEARASQAGMRIEASRRETLRSEKKQPVEGLVFALDRPA